MNSKLGTLISILLMLGGISLWSVSILGAELPTDGTSLALQTAGPADGREDNRSRAADANRDAVEDAVRRLREANRLELDIALVGRTSITVAGT